MAVTSAVAAVAVFFIIAAVRVSRMRTENQSEWDGWKMRILVTAFEPFGGDGVNPTMEVLSRLQPREGLSRLVLPVTFQGAGAALTRAVETIRPDAVLSLGLAGGRDRITPERVAINLDDARISDNDGLQPVDQPIVPGGPDAYFSTLPVREIVRRIEALGIPAGLSLSAGTYVCNHVMYTALHLAKTKYPGMRCGFVHVPYMDEMPHAEGKPSLPLADIVRAVEETVRVIAGEDA